MAELVAIFGGTFDPVHKGHLGAVAQICQRLPFDRVHWVLSARPPHKNQVTASIEHRFAMMQLGLAGNERYVADDIEIRRLEPSYTIDTVETFKQRHPTASLFVIIGADSLQRLPSWHRSAELIEQVNWVVMHRPGHSLKAPSELSARLIDCPSKFPATAGGKIWCYENSDFDISSTSLRAELKQQAGELAKEYLPSAILNYIREHQLYKIESMKPEDVKDQVVDALENIKGQDIKVIDIADISDFADYMVVASGTSDTHVKALAREASDTLRKQGVKPLNEDGADVGEWVLVDFGDVVLHVMRPEVREYYDLEKLWDEDVRALVKQHREQEDS